MPLSEKDLINYSKQAEAERQRRSRMRTAAEVEKIYRKILSPDSSEDASSSSDETVLSSPRPMPQRPSYRNTVRVPFPLAMFRRFNRRSRRIEGGRSPMVTHHLGTPRSSPLTHNNTPRLEPNNRGVTVPPPPREPRTRTPVLGIRRLGRRPPVSPRVHDENNRNNRNNGNNEKFNKRRPSSSSLSGHVPSHSTPGRGGRVGGGLGARYQIVHSRAKVVQPGGATARRSTGGRNTGGGATRRRLARVQPGGATATATTTHKRVKIEPETTEEGELNATSATTACAGGKNPKQVLRGKNPKQQRQREQARQKVALPARTKTRGSGKGKVKGSGRPQCPGLIKRPASAEEPTHVRKKNRAEPMVDTLNNTRVTQKRPRFQPQSFIRTRRQRAHEERLEMLRVAGVKEE